MAERISTMAEIDQRMRENRRRWKRNHPTEYRIAMTKVGEGRVAERKAMGTGYAAAAKRGKKKAEEIRKMPEGKGPQMEGGAKAPKKKKVKVKRQRVNQGPKNIPRATPQETKVLAQKAVAHVRAQKKGGSNIRVTKTQPRGSFSSAQRVAARVQETGRTQVTSLRASGMGQVKAPTQVAPAPRVMGTQTGSKYATHGVEYDVASPKKERGFITERPRTRGQSQVREYAERQVAKGHAQDVAKAKAYRQKVSAELREGKTRPQASRAAMEKLPEQPKAGVPAHPTKGKPAGGRIPTRTNKMLSLEGARQWYNRKPPTSTPVLEGAGKLRRAGAAVKRGAGKALWAARTGPGKALGAAPLMIPAAVEGALAARSEGRSMASGAAMGTIQAGALHLGMKAIPGAVGRGVRFAAGRAALPLTVAETGYQTYKLGKAVHGARKAQAHSRMHGEGLKRMGFAVQRPRLLQGAWNAFSDKSASTVRVAMRNPEKAAQATAGMRRKSESQSSAKMKRKLKELRAAKQARK